MRTAASPRTVPPKRPASPARLKDLRESSFMRAWLPCCTVVRADQEWMRLSPLLVCERLDHTVRYVDARADVHRFLQDEVEFLAFRDLLDDLVCPFEYRGQFLVLAQVEILAQFPLHALQVAVHAREVLLLVAAFRFAHGHAVLFQAALELPGLLGEFLQVLIAGREFLFDLLLRLYGRRRFLEQPFELDEAYFQFRSATDIRARHQRCGGQHKRDLVQRLSPNRLIYKTKTPFPARIAPPACGHRAWR